MNFKKALLKGLAVIISVGIFSTGCGDKETSSKVVIYSNADEEPIEAIKKALDESDMKDKYIIQSFGTSELGGKLLAEGKNIEADMVTMSSFYLDSAQEKENLFIDFEPDIKSLESTPKFRYPLTVQEGAIFYNTNAIKDSNLTAPKSLKELADSKYADNISLSDINHSSTAWLTIQALIDAYGEDESEKILSDIYKNAGDHLESSGSAPLKKVRVGEVPIGIGLRHQAVLDKQAGQPIDFVDPEEGTFSLTESIAIIDKGNAEKEENAKKIADIILKEARKEIINMYPTALYEGESVSSEFESSKKKVFPQELTVDLLKTHQELSEKAKGK